MGLMDKANKFKTTGLDTASKFKATGIPQEEVQKYLTENEEIVDIIAQIIPRKTKTLVLTNERILIFTKELLKTTFADYYFKDMKDVHFSSDRVKQGILSISTDRNNSSVHTEIKYLPVDDARNFYVKMQRIEKIWADKKRELDLEDKRASSGASSIVVSGGGSEKAKDDSIESKLETLASLRKKGLIDETTYKNKRQQLIDQL